MLVGCVAAPVANATLIDTDVLVFQGAVFTLQGEWKDNRYLMTYQASFAGFQGSEGPSYLKAIDWKWEGDTISSVSLLEAPGSKDQWLAQTNRQISTGDSVGCQPGGGANAVCTEFLGDSRGFSTLTDITDLRWVFELSFNELRQRNVFLGDGLRAAFVNGSGTLTSPIMSCAGAQNPGCPDQRIELQALSDDNGSVPLPGVPALLLAGLAGLFLGRRRG
jgi:MYXO-CTERM domain-containing protein